jgi:flagellar operon protein
MNINSFPIKSIQQVSATNRQTVQKSGYDNESDFSAILNQKLSEGRDVKMSKHAAMRLEARNINLNSEQVERLKSAVDKASVKGVRDTLVVMDELAFVVNVGARTVITAVNKNELKENVFTNIDGAVFT